jgi:hypothetical protein
MPVAVEPVADQVPEDAPVLGVLRRRLPLDHY